MFDRVYVGVLNNSSKNATFTPEERVEMIERVIQENGFTNVEAEHFGGLLVNFVSQKGATHIIRGLRASMDFEYEFQIDAMNRHLAPEIRTVYFMANPVHSFVSSSNVREIASLGGSIKGLVPECNINKITERLGNA